MGAALRCAVDARTVTDHANTGVMTFEPNSRHGRIAAFLYVFVLFYVGRGLAMVQPPSQETLPNMIIVSEVTSELEQV
jgi:hypothetical protein